MLIKWARLKEHGEQIKTDDWRGDHKLNILRLNIYYNKKVYNKKFSEMGPSIRHGITLAWESQWEFDVFVLLSQLWFAWIL